MNDIEKEFEKLLRHHEVPPPPAVWDQLSTGLAQKRKKKVFYWQVAAAVALLLLGTLAIAFFHIKPSSDTVSQRKQPVSLVPKETPAAPTEQTEAVPALKEVPAPSEPIASIAPPTQERVAAQEQPRSDEPDQIDAQLSQSSNAPVQSPSVLPVQKPVRFRLAVMHPKVPEVVNIPVLLAPPQVALPPAQELALSDPQPAAVAQRRSVTVIYKPGNRSLQAAEDDQDEGLLSKTLTFLEDVKKNGLAYSELRSAKSELINNVFSRHQNDQQ